MSTATIGSTAGAMTGKRTVYSADGSVTEIYKTPVGNASTLIGSVTIGTTTRGSLLLAEISDDTSKGSSQISFKFVTPEKYTSSFNGTGTGAVKDASTVCQAEPITSHPKFTGTAEDPIIDGNPKPNVQSYLVPHSTYRRTNLQSSFTFSQSNIIDSLGTRDSPTGLSSATANQWLKVSIEASEEGENVRVTETWQHNPLGWDTDIYA